MSALGRFQPVAATSGFSTQDFKEIALDVGLLDADIGVYTVNALEQRTFWREADQLLMLRTGGVARKSSFKQRILYQEQTGPHGIRARQGWHRSDSRSPPTW